MIFLVQMTSGWFKAKYGMEYLNDWMLIYRKFSELFMLFERYDDDVIVFMLLLLGFCYGMARFFRVLLSVRLAYRVTIYENVT